MFDTPSGGTSAAVPVLGKSDWTVDNSTPTFPTTAFGDSNQSQGAGLPNAAMTVSGFWDASDASWKNVLGASAGRKAYLYPDFTNNVTDYFYGSFYASIQSKGGVEGAVGQDWSLTASGWAGWH